MGIAFSACCIISAFPLTCYLNTLTAVYWSTNGFACQYKRLELAGMQRYCSRPRLTRRAQSHGTAPAQARPAKGFQGPLASACCSANCRGRLQLFILLAAALGCSCLGGVPAAGATPDWEGLSAAHDARFIAYSVAAGVAPLEPGVNAIMRRLKCCFPAWCARSVGCHGRFCAVAPHMPQQHCLSAMNLYCFSAFGI